MPKVTFENGHIHIAPDPENENERLSLIRAELKRDPSKAAKYTKADLIAALLDGREVK